MRKTSVLLAVLVAVLSTAAVNAQDYADAKALLEAALEKTGGDKWASVESMVMSSSMTIDSPQGEMMGTAKLTFVYPGFMHARILLDMDDGSGMPMGPITQVMTPDTGFVQTDQGNQPMPGGNGPKAATDELELLKDDGPELALATDTLDGTPVYKVTATTDEQTASHYYAMDSLMRVAKSVSTPAGEQWIRYSDYQEVDGLVVPFTMTQDMAGGMKQVIKAKKVEINPELDKAKLFGDM